MSSSYDLADVEAFIPATVGVPGARTFYLQIAASHQLISLKCEKVQVSALAEALQRMLVDLPPVQGSALVSMPDLQGPLVSEWIVGSIGLGYETSLDRIVVLLEEAAEEDTPDAGQVRVALTRAQAGAFAARGLELIRSGRPPCVLCGSPIDPVTGYTCVCFN